jgi:hypothetical protein
LHSLPYIAPSHRVTLLGARGDVTHIAATAIPRRSFECHHDGRTQREQTINKDANIEDADAFHRKLPVASINSNWDLPLRTVFKCVDAPSKGSAALFFFRVSIVQNKQDTNNTSIALGPFGQ